jgi:hypothetical protein
LTATQWQPLLSLTEHMLDVFEFLQVKEVAVDDPERNIQDQEESIKNTEENKDHCVLYRSC